MCSLQPCGRRWFLFPCDSWKTESRLGQVARDPPLSPWMTQALNRGWSGPVLFAHSHSLPFFPPRTASSTPPHWRWGHDVSGIRGAHKEPSGLHSYCQKRQRWGETGDHLRTFFPVKTVWKWVPAQLEPWKQLKSWLHDPWKGVGKQQQPTTSTLELVGSPTLGLPH